MKFWVNEARLKWPKAIWIIGNGPYASVSACNIKETVILFETLAEAEIAKNQIDKTACGGKCKRNHFIIDLHKEFILDLQITPNNQGE